LLERDGAIRLRSDAAFLRARERTRARALAQELGMPFGVLACEAPLQVLRQRLLDRKNDASEADVAVLEQLMATAEPLSSAERELTCG
jgi:predicted kinase